MRSVVLYHAKEALKLFQYRGIQTKGYQIESYPEGYTVRVLDGETVTWTVMLTNRGVVIKAIQHKS